jgi:hypothetical protein
MTSEFLREVLEACRSDMEGSDDGNIRQLSLVQVLLNRLEDVARIAPPNVAFYVDQRGSVAAEVHGYACDSEGEAIQLFFVIDETFGTAADLTAEIVTTPSDRIERAFRRLESFVSRAMAGKITNIDESDPAHELLVLLREASVGKQSIELYVLTTGQATYRRTKNKKDSAHLRDVWDIVVLERTCGSKSSGIIEVDFAGDHGGSLPCLVMPPNGDGVQVVLTSIPGDVLADIYLTHRAELLERNVRCFLQVRGKVNRGIRDTLLNQPEMLLPYNNGLSATASGIHLTDAGDGVARIARVSDFQVVNGGQTTATIAHCASKDGADLSNVRVAMKLTVVPPEKIDAIVPQISRCANTQNKVQDADFSANDPWHIRLEQISRTLWTAPTADAVRGTRWFYERSHGQYADELGRSTTVAAKRTFRVENPPTQKITKTDAAKYLLGWEQYPVQVTKGAQKAFTVFMQTAAEGWPESKATPDAASFKKIVALAILHKAIERLYGEMQFQGYRSQVVAFAVARLSLALNKAIDVEAFWKKQAVPTNLIPALKLIVPAVREVVLDAPASHRNISEWCKKDACWSAVSRLALDLGALARAASAKGEEPASSDGGPSYESCDVLIDALRPIPGGVWFALSAWAKQTNNFNSWQRGLAYSLGMMANKQKSPTTKQAIQASRLLLESVQAGFSHAELSSALVASVRKASVGLPG